MDASELDDDLKFERDSRERWLQSANLEDAVRLVRIFVRLDSDGRVEMLYDATRQLVRLASVHKNGQQTTMTDEELDNEIATRIRNARPSMGIDDLYVLARDYEPEADQYFFSDGVANVLLGPAADTYKWAESMVETYTSIAREHLTGLPSLEEHFRGTRVSQRRTQWLHPKVVHAEAVSYFADLLFEWRDRLLRQLFADLESS